MSTYFWGWLLFCGAVLFFTSFLESEEQGILESFNSLASQPRVLRFKNDLEVNNSGGHLQGVQLLERGDDLYAIVTGSSDTYSYYSVARIADEKRVISVNRLMDRPYKHAGGFQIFRDLLAVGIEDNSEKDKSRVCFYQIDDPEIPGEEPVAVIERLGDAYRATAGCTGIVGIGEKLLVVVGDWDTRHLDFYVGSADQIGQGSQHFEHVFSIDTDSLRKSDGPTAGWRAYQNVNLLEDKDGTLYMFGFERGDRGEDIADLFLVEHKNLRQFSLKKIGSRTFECREGASFRAGAGVSELNDGSLSLTACGAHITNELVLNVFQ